VVEILIVVEVNVGGYPCHLCRHMSLAVVCRRDLFYRVFSGLPSRGRVLRRVVSAFRSLVLASLLLPADCVSVGVV
jgi:hypothetical protein